MAFHLTREQLLIDLHQAYYDARRHKRKKSYQQHFERHVEANLEQLCNELFARTYRPGTSTCFIITDPKRREVFAAQFRDRIVHHLYYNYVHVMLERTFIHDSYSCIKHRGTHYGIARLERHIRRESQNYTIPCYVLKMDISGYFMHISRRILFDITLRHLRKMAKHRVMNRKTGVLPTNEASTVAYSPFRWSDCVDMDFVEWLTRIIIMQNPTEDCCRRGSLLDWLDLPRDKSLFYSPPGCGLPIGNLTSQLFSNVYLNELDQYMKRQLGCRHYGRYVDDFYIVSTDRKWLLSLRKPVTDYLRVHLGLKINEGKTMLCDVRMGVEFLGSFLKPRRRYVSCQSLGRLTAKIQSLERKKSPQLLRSSLNSFLGLLSHYRSYHLRHSLFYNMAYVFSYGYYVKGMCKYVLFPTKVK